MPGGSDNGSNAVTDYDAASAWLDSALSDRAYPMWVMHVQAVLELDRFLPHEELLALGKLVAWRRGMKVLFVSHTWLKYKFPDNDNNDKLRLLQTMLRKMRLGKLPVEADWTQAVQGQNFNISAKRFKADMENGFVWLDLGSVPQQDGNAQSHAIESIPSYVRDSTYFMVLACEWQHENGSTYGECVWSRRGWCRLEQLGNALAPEEKPIIVVRTARNPVNQGPGGRIGNSWFLNPVGLGEFTVESDRVTLGPVIAEMVEVRKAIAIRRGTPKEMCWFRILSVCQNHLCLGTGFAPSSSPKSPPSLATWLTSLRFKSIHEGSNNGLTPLRFAVMAGRIDLVKTMLEMRADADAPLRSSFPRLEMEKGQTILCTALQMRDDTEILELLLAFRADHQCRVGQTGITPLFFALQNGRIKSLDCIMKFDPNSADVPASCGIYPFETAGSWGQQELFRHLLSKYPERMRSVTQGCNAQGLSLAAMTVSLLPDVAMLETVIAARADVNINGPMTSTFFKRIQSATNCLAMLPWRPSFLVETWAYFANASALHIAAATDSKACVRTLLAAAADVDSTRSSKRMTPLHVAALRGCEQIAMQLLEARASSDIHDATGRTPMQWAMKRGHLGIARLLQPSHDLSP